MKTLKIISLLLIVLSISVYRKNDDNDSEKIITDVYVAGYEVINNKSVSTMWKNCTATRLSTSDKTTCANAIYANGNDVYVVGYENINGVYKARL